MTKDYRPNAGIMLINADGLVFMAQRSDNRAPAWQMPQGGIDDDEDPLTAAKRELFEETNVSSVKLVAESAHWYTYDFPSDVSFFSKKKKKYKGQRQKWFLFLFTGDESEIDLTAHDKEFSDWTWMKAQSVPEHIVSFKRGVYDAVVNEFMPFIEAVAAQKAG